MECTFNQTNQIAGKISKDDIDATFIAQVTESQTPLDCLWTIEVQPDWQVRAPHFFLFAFYSHFDFYLYLCLCLRLKSTMTTDLDDHNHIPTNQ